MNAPAPAANEHGTAPGRVCWAATARSAGTARSANRAAVPTTTSLPGRPGVVTGLVVAAAVVVRLLPLLSRHMLGGLLEYDDGVYYDASVHLIGGTLPYRDFVFLQPPGVLLLLAPFAALARLAGDPAAMIAARLAIIMAAAINVWLLMRLIRRSCGQVAAVAAGATYAAWGGAAAAERTVLLEPLIGLGLLCAMTLLDPRARSGTHAGSGAAARSETPGATRGRSGPRPLRARVPVAAGVVLGLALAVKTWAAADIAVLGAWLLWRSGWRAALALASAALGAAAVVCLPFFAAGPGAMFHQVIVDQLGRTERLTPDPVVFMHQVAGVGQLYGRSGAPPWAAVAVLAMFAAAVVTTFRCGPGIWAVLAVIQAALVLPQHSYTYHYIDFAAPALAACTGIAAAALLRAAARLGRLHGFAATVARLAMAVALAALAFQSATEVVVGSPAAAQFRAFFAAHPCAFSDYPSLLSAADANTRQVGLHCANLVDYTGAALAAGNGQMLTRERFGNRSGLYRVPAWQAQVRAVLAASDAALLSLRPQRWTPATWLFFHQRFRWFGKVGYFTLWTVR